MPKIDWNSVEETKSTGGIQKLPSGAYMCVITSASYKVSNNNNPMLELLYDISEGPHKGFFSGDFWGNKAFRHRDCIMLAGGGLGFAKHKLHCLADWNDGFKPTALIDADQSEPFVGKRCCLLLQEHKYTYNGRDQSKVEVVDWLKPEQFESGDFKVPDTIDEREAAPEPAPAPTTATYVPDVAADDIPF